MSVAVCVRHVGGRGVLRGSIRKKGGDVDTHIMGHHGW